MWNQAPEEWELSTLFSLISDQWREIFISDQWSETLIGDQWREILTTCSDQWREII